MIDLSVVIPARDERDNVAPLLDELAGALQRLGLRHEVIVVDDGSTDGTDEAIAEQLDTHPGVRGLRLEAAAGQTAALRAGLAAARGAVLATMDADLQNDPADLRPLLEVLHRTGADLVQGDRTARRCDGPLKRLSSGVARAFRRVLLGDRVRDTGCTLRVMRRAVAGALPLQYRGMHRFVPALARHLGFTVIEHPVNHRPRAAGRTHYGIRNRALTGLVDLLAVRWMTRRRSAAPVVRELRDSAPPVFTFAPRPARGDARVSRRSVR